MSKHLTMSYWPGEESAGVRDLTLPRQLREVAEASPNQVALVDGLQEKEHRSEWTYQELLAEVEHAAKVLLTHFEPGDRVAIWAPNAAEWVILQQAMAMAGLVIVAANPAYQAHELGYVLKQAKVAGLFYVDEYRGKQLGTVVDKAKEAASQLTKIFTFDEWAELRNRDTPNIALPVVQPTDPVQIQYTSGTTGFPKGAVLHHKGIINEATFVAERADMSRGDVCINAMPLYHIGGGAVTELATIASHGTYVVMPQFDPQLTLELFETYKGTHSLMVPTMLLAVLDHPTSKSWDLSSVKTIMSGAAPVSEALVQRVIDRWNCQFSILFGQTEMHGVTNQTRVTDDPQDQATSVGQPLPELEMKVVDVGTGETLPIGQQGELCARGYQNMLGYFDWPEKTEAAIDEDGWLHMGDLGVMDERGFVKVTGRLKDMIIRGGTNLYPLEIEQVLADHPDFADIVVLGVPHAKLGEEVCAVVRLREGCKKPAVDELKVWCREQISAHKVPSRWYFTEEYPQTPSGKIQKFMLLEQIEQGALEPVVLATRSKVAS